MWQLQTLPLFLSNTALKVEFLSSPLFRTVGSRLNLPLQKGGEGGGRVHYMYKLYDSFLWMGCNYLNAKQNHYEETVYLYSRTH